MADTTPSQPTPLERATEWAAAEPDLSIGDDGHLLVAGDPPLAFDIATADDRLTVSYRVPGPVAAGDLPGRASLVRTGEVDAGGGRVLSVPIYLDGLGRQSFLDAVRALIGAAETAAAATPAPATARTTAERQAVEEPEATREMPAVWTPTHAVPAGGTGAWANPDPSAAPTATLEARVRLSIAEHRGDWVRVIGSNGWTGWVDARVLEPLGAEAATAKATGATGATGGGPNQQVRIISVIGAAVIGLSALTPWASPGAGGSSNAFDLSSRFLWDYTASGAPELGWVLVGLGVLALLVALRGTTPVRVLVGFMALAVAGMFCLQLYRGITDVGGSFSDVMDIIGFAPLVTVAGGILVMVGAKK